MKEILAFYKGKRVLITGHTGFKGTWLCHILLKAGAKITGFSLEPPTTENLFTLSDIEDKIDSVIGDVRDLKHLKEVFERVRPEVVFHLAAQPLVRESYQDPVYTYETNVMGTVHVLECVRNTPSILSFLNVTTDKVYDNKEWAWGYRETDPLDGYDPYSNSKSCSELATHSYIHSFFDTMGVPASTARAGNVIGGGDFAKDRIIPDCIKAALEGRKIEVRNPNSLRPYQHVLEPLMAYLLIAAKQAQNKQLAGYYNVGPDDIDCVTTGQLADIFCKKWEESVTWENQADGGPHEANFLKLDCSKIKTSLGYRPVWNIETAVEKTVAWTKVYREKGNIPQCMDQQIQEYLDDQETLSYRLKTVK